MHALTPRQARELKQALNARLQGTLRLDALTRALYSTDASIYQIEPLGVAYPRVEEDLFVLAEVAADLGIPLLARGAGTSLAGQAVGAALVVDCSRHLHHILDVDAEQMQATVQPGVAGAALDSAAAPSGLMLGPDPASADRATLGGMIANNATGAHSIRYGMLADHLRSAEVVFSDGTGAELGPVGEGRARQLAAPGTRRGQVYAAALALRSEAAEAVRAGWPRVWRRASGYALDRLVGHVPSLPAGWYLEDGAYPPERGLNLSALLAGSEGTLALIRRATVRLVPRPGATALVVLDFASLAAACDAVPDLLATRPAAVELIPHTIWERARRVPAYARRLSGLPIGAVFQLAVEYTGDDPAEARRRASALAGRGTLLENPAAQADFWAVRKAGLGLLMSVHGDTKPVSFIEDVTVPVERLGDYVQRVEALLTEHGTRGEWYAHASAGCLHMRPLLNLKSEGGVRALRTLSSGVLEEAVRLGGVMSGEHGDGLSHSEHLPALFGPEILGAFRALKQAFDPAFLLNPGKIVPAPGAPPPRLDENLRYGPAYRTAAVQTVFAFRREGGFARAVEECNGAGVCLQSGGVMCPSYQATREEADGTRGRANALRAALSGRLSLSGLSDPALYDVLDLCVQCKGCKSECPSAVDLGRVKAEFLHQYQAVHGTPLRSRLFAEYGALARAARPAARLINALTPLRPTRRLLEAALGISRARVMPALAPTGFRRWFMRRAAPHPDGRSPVVLFVDTFVEHNHPEIGRAAVRVLEAAGCAVEVVPRQGCCGRTHISKGLLRRARALAQRNLEALSQAVARGLPVVGLEPSCVAALRDEYLDFFPDDPRARRLAEAACTLEEFLTRPGPDGRPPLERLHFTAPSAPWLVHSHCHTRAGPGGGPTLELLRATGAAVEEIDSGCCGMAGSFGYEVEHQAVSMQIAEQRLLPAVRDGLRRGCMVVAAGASCRAQILDGAGVRPLHPAEALASALAAPARGTEPQRSEPPPSKISAYP